MNFNGTDMTSIIKVNKITGRGLAEWEVSTLSVPNRDGLYYRKGARRRKERIIDVDFTVMAGSMTELRAKVDELNAILDVDEPKPLIFPDEPDKTYYAIPEAPNNGDDGVDYINQSTIKFICPDPYKYGPEREITFESSASFNVESTVETEPVIEVTLKADTEYVAVSNGTDINMVGFPAKQEEIVTEWQTPIFITSGQTLTGWTTSAEPSLGGVPLGGELKTNGDRFYADDYGYNPHQWHGPAMKTSLSEPIQDFQFDVGFRMKKTGNNQCGAIRISLLDASSESVCNIEMTKHYGGVDTLYPQVLARGNVVLSESQGQVSGYFGGVVRVFRQGNKFTAFMWQIRDGDGVWVKLAETNWLDTSNVATAKVTQVQIRLLQRADFPVCEQWIDDIQIHRLNDLNANQVPIIGRTGDIIVFDHQNDNILRNGESIIKNKAFIGEYFKLRPGLNQLVVEPIGVIGTTKVRYRPKWH